MKAISRLALILTCFVRTTSAAQEAPPATARVPDVVALDLESGVRVLLLPMPQCEFVVVEAIYGVGFMDDPEQVPQAAHLLEHLAAPAEHSETLADCTRFESTVPRAELAQALEREVRRYGGATIDAAGVQRAAQRCQDEALLAATALAARMTSQALTVLGQAWRHGLAQARLFETPDQTSSESLMQLTRLRDRGARALTLVVAGGFEENVGRELAQKYFGDALVEGVAPVAPSIDWRAQPRAHGVEWDAPINGICIAYEPPSDPRDQLLMSWLTPTLGQFLRNNRSLSSHVSHVATSSRIWRVGKLPIFIYATLQPQADVAQAERALLDQIDAWVERGANRSYHRTIIAQSRLSVSRSLPDWARIAEEADYAAAVGDKSIDEATRAVLAQVAQERAVVDRLLGPDVQATLEVLGQLTREDIGDVLQRSLGSDQRFVTRLVARKAK